MRIEGHKVKRLRGKEISLVKVVWEGAAGESLTCGNWRVRCENRTQKCLNKVHLRGRKYSKWGRVVTPYF